MLFAVVAALIVATVGGCAGRDDNRPAAAEQGQAFEREVVVITSDGLRLAATHHQVDDPRTSVTVLVAHGNGGDRASRLPLAEALTKRGMNVFLLEYRGYGGNPGRPTEPGLVEDGAAAYRYLVDEAGVPPNRLLYFGESLGTAVVARLARVHPPAGVILRSPFETYAAVGIDAYYPDGRVPVSPGDVFATAEHVAALDVPVSVVWGNWDTLVPPGQSRLVADKARRLVAAVEVQGADHNDQTLLDGKQLVDAVVQLAEHVGRMPLADPAATP